MFALEVGDIHQLHYFLLELQHISCYPHQPIEPLRELAEEKVSEKQSIGGKSTYITRLISCWILPYLSCEICCRCITYGGIDKYKYRRWSICWVPYAQHTTQQQIPTHSCDWTDSMCYKQVTSSPTSCSTRFLRREKKTISVKPSYRTLSWAHTDQFIKFAELLCVWTGYHMLVFSSHKNKHSVTCSCKLFTWMSARPSSAFDTNRDILVRVLWMTSLLLICPP